MENIAIIITGQIRTFFSNNYFTDVLNRCIDNYNKILIICVINSNNQNDFISLKNYFSNFKIHELILINYSDEKYQNEYNIKMNDKYNNPKFLEIRNKYMNLNTDAHKEIYDPITCSNSIPIQFHQISTGIQKLIDYQNQTNINFDITFKTRFDIRYPNNFYPHIHKSDNIIDILSFNDINKNLLLNAMNKYNLETLDDLIDFNKNNVIKPHDCRIKNKDHLAFSFGGEYVSNYISLEYIKSGNKNILYSFGDFFEFGKTINMIYFNNLFNDFWIKEPNVDELYNHFYSPEIQIILFCLNNNLSILFYNNDSFLYVR